MAITLTSSQDVINKSGNDNFALAAGKTLKIEWSPSGEEILNEEVPAGKSWDVYVSVFIIESDA